MAEFLLIYLGHEPFSQIMNTDQAVIQRNRPYGGLTRPGVVVGDGLEQYGELGSTSPINDK